MPIDEPPDVTDPFLIPGIVHDQMTVVSGRPESGKSFLALSPAYAVGGR